MNVVIIGVSDRSILWRHGSIPEADYDAYVQQAAQALADNFENAIVTPSDGVYTDIALAVGKIKETKPIAYYPDQDTYYGYDELKPNFDKYDLKPIGGDWYKLDADITKQARTVVCFGFSPGALIELSFIKYHQKYGGYKDASLKDIRLLIDMRCIDTPLPASVQEQINNIEYFSSFDELRTLLN